MFTGIIEEIGKIERFRNNVLSIKASKVLEGMNLGDSLAVNGICLTVTKFSDTIFEVDVMNETLSRTSLYKFANNYVNLERALSINGRFGGHIVTGHIDGIGKIISITKDSNAVWYKIETDRKINTLIVEKGSIAIDGVSLTVAKVGDKDFSVSIIPHTLNQTILKYKRVGDIVNLESDILGKYLHKFFSTQRKSISNNLIYENLF